VGKAVFDNETVATGCCGAVTETVRLEVLLRVLCWRSPTLAGSCRVAEGVNCEVMIADDIIVGIWVLETCDESVFAHAVEGIGSFAVGPAFEMTGTPLTVDDVDIGEADFNEPEDERLDIEV
jgi:hypothetical protein